MSADVHRLATRPERIRRDGAAALESALRSVDPDLVPAWMLRDLLNRVHRAMELDASRSIWPGGFSMISVQQTVAVWDWIRALPGRDRPHAVRHAFDLVLSNLRQDTGEVMLRREEFADRMGVRVQEASSALSLLARAGVLRVERMRVEGLRGPGLAVYFINPHVAWNGQLEARASVAKSSSPPLLKLMQGGVDDGSPVADDRQVPLL